MKTQRTIDVSGFTEDMVRAVQVFVAQLRSGSIVPAPQTETSAEPKTTTLAEIAASVATAVPISEWEKLPRDLAKNFDHC